VAEGLVEDPLFDQRYRFSRKGDVLRVEIWADPGGGVTVEHLHPRFEERFEVYEGEITFRVDGAELKVGPGGRLAAAPGVRHCYQNTGGGQAHLAAEAEPALDLRESIEEAAAMARAGKFTRSGRPKGVGALLEAAEFAQRYRETTVVTFPPLAVQKVLMPPLAWLQRRRQGRRG
jgi:mannose-6-phosphate isomerase-like protein (cupin superfamily)